MRRDDGIGWVARGSAFGTGFFFVPIIAVPVLLVLAVILFTHLWYVALLVFCVALGAIAGIVKQLAHRPTKVEIMESRNAAYRLATHNAYHRYEKRAGCPYC